MAPRDLALLAAPPPSAGTAEPARDARAFYAATDVEGRRQLTLGLVHEMNNLIGGIAVLSEIYQDGSAVDNGVTEGLALIHQSTNRLQSLVTHLKTLNGPSVSEPVYLKLPETVRALFEMYAPLLPKTLAVVMAFPQEELVVHLDEALLRRVLLNLTLNLRDDLGCHPETTDRLHVGIRTRPCSKVELTLSVSGLGLDRSADACARLADARQCLCKMGGTLIAHTSSEYLLEFSLVL